MQIQFGPPPKASCTNVASDGLCLAVTTFNVPAGNRLVIENISAVVTFTPNGGTDVLQESISLGLNVNGSISVTITGYLVPTS